MEIQINQPTVDEIARQLSQNHKGEIRAGYLIGRIESDKIVVEGVYVPKQKSNELFTTFDLQAQVEAFENISKEGKRIVGLAQYNAQFAPFASATTNQTLQNLAFSPKIGLVVNAKGKYEIIQ